jgi:hypothetical protein
MVFEVWMALVALSAHFAKIFFLCFHGGGYFESSAVRRVPAVPFEALGAAVALATGVAAILLMYGFTDGRFYHFPDCCTPGDSPTQGDILRVAIWCVLLVPLEVRFLLVVVATDLAVRSLVGSGSTF